MNDPVSTYKQTMAELLLRREFEDLALVAEQPFTDVLEAEWERMTENQQAEVDAWVRKMVSPSPAGELAAALDLREEDDVRVAPRKDAA